MTAHQPPKPHLDHARIRRAFHERGYRVNEVANRLDLSNTTVEALLRGTLDLSDLRLATLAALAGLLGIPLRALFTEEEPSNPPPHDDESSSSSPQNTQADAEQLIACLYDTGATPTLIHEIAAAFAWTLDQTRAAAVEADTRLRPAGLRINTGHGELSIVPLRDHDTHRQALAARKAYERGLHLNHYKAVFQILSGEAVAITKSARQQRLTLGGLVNQGILDQLTHPNLTPAALETFPDAGSAHSEP